MLSIQNLNIFTESNKQLLFDVSFNINSGRFQAVVGESGSGKSLTALSIAQLLDENLSTSGKIEWKGENTFNYNQTELENFRKTELAFVFQNPMHCLNPVIRCGEQIAEVYKLHGKNSSEISIEIDKVLNKVHLTDTQRIKESYPHELSGGQKQRIMIAIALASDAKLLIADEPSTALDVLVQKEILELLKQLQKNDGLSVLFITHDLKLAFKYADDIMVMRNGKIVEQNTASEIEFNPIEKYTQGLINCRPQKDKYLRPLPTVEEFIENKNIEKSNEKTFSTSQEKLFSVKDLNFSYGDTPVLFNINFEVLKEESLGIVGASGSGKSTVGKCLMRILESYSGKIELNSKDINTIDIKSFRSEVQMIFQDPYGSLDGRPKVRKQLEEIYKTYFPKQSKSERLIEMEGLMNKVGLDKSFLETRPRDLSGGQRQRICIARGLISGAKTLILDESIAALDVSIQATIINLLNNLKDELGLTYIFISHDLESVHYFCDRILVLNKGKIEEIGHADQIMNDSHSLYTKQLIEASI